MYEITIKKLFGRFDYKILLKDKEITIVTGPNGYGKSTIIRCINAVFRSDISFFGELVFDKFSIELVADEFSDDSDRHILYMEKNGDSLTINGKTFGIRQIKQIGKGNTVRKKIAIEKLEEATGKKDVYAEVLQEMGSFFQDVVFIGEQRLFGEWKSAFRPAWNTTGEIRKGADELVEEIPYKLIKRFGTVNSRYSQRSNELDSTYLERLFNEERGISEDEFQDKINIIRGQIQKLNQNGISTMKELKNVSFRSEDSRALKVYFDDFDAKFAIYDGFIKRLEMFVEIINKRFRFKKIKISGEKGLLVVDEDTNKPIMLSRLSSGEKECIVLFYTILFEVSDDSLLLIDEPEISLHIAWQRMFIEDLKRIVALKRNTVLVATHSPQIISGNRELQVDLGEEYKDGFNQGKQDKG